MTNYELLEKQVTELLNTEPFYVASMSNISSLIMPKNMPNLTYVDIEKNSIPSINLSTATKLRVLGCSENNLSSLDVTACKDLYKLYCDSNGISKLDLSKNTNLTNLECSYTKLTSLDLSNNTLLERVRCVHRSTGENDTSPKIKTLKAKNLPYLTYLSCEGNDIATLDFSGDTALAELYCINCC
jgi:Leucine-rich repeat (LRR) protein